MFERIVVPLDGSARAEQALPVAARIARGSGGSIHLLQVVSPPIDYSGGMAPVALMTEESIEMEMADSTSYLNTVASWQMLAGIKTTTEVLFGLPAVHILALTSSVELASDVASALVSLAEYGGERKKSGEVRGCDLIAISTHGRGGL